MLSRDTYGKAVAPVRTVHLGLGNFFRAHSAWYTEHTSSDWGIAAFSGRSDTHVAELAAQDCLYTLVVQGKDVQTEVHDAERRHRFWVNESAPTFLHAEPPAKQGEARFEVEFGIDFSRLDFDVSLIDTIQTISDLTLAQAA